MAQALKPAITVATRGFVVDETFRQQTLDNEERFRALRATRKLFLPGATRRRSAPSSATPTSRRPTPTSASAG